MKRVHVLITLWVATSSVLCYGGTNPSVFAGGGVTLLSSPEDLSKTWGDGYHLSFGFGYPAGVFTDFQVQVQYHNFGDTTGSVYGSSLYDTKDKDRSLRVLKFMIALKLDLAKSQKPLIPYAISGIGVIRVTDYLLTRDETGMGGELFVGPGLELRLSENLALYAQASFTFGIFDRHKGLSSKAESMLTFPLEVGLVLYP